jgi:hypothetical protein
MFEYHKIQSVFKRDEKTNFQTFLMGEYSIPEFEYLKDNQWTFTEKVDGTNIRAIWSGEGWSFGGRTDRAQIPNYLLEALDEVFTPTIGKMKEMFNELPVCFYGEGYGPKIQKGGGNYRDSCSFVLFDIFVNGIWLKREDVDDIARENNIDSVPILGYGTLNDALTMVQKGFTSQWGNFTAEGLVLRPTVELLDRRGQRIITKVKHKDFKEVG